jgi:hypothetical protein
MSAFEIPMSAFEPFEGAHLNSKMLTEMAGFR